MIWEVLWNVIGLIWDQKLKVFQLVVSVVLSRFVFSYSRSYYRNQRYEKMKQTYLKNFKQRCDDFLKEYEGKVDTKRQEEICKLKLSQIQEQFRSKRLTSTELVITQLLRAIKLGVPRGYILDLNFKKAIEEAARCDKQRNGKDLPPLLGIPIFTKDHLQSADMISIMGVLHRLEQPTIDCEYIKTLKSQGAIIVGITTAPQLALTNYTFNNLTGNAINPFSSRHTTGGSSGGSGGVLSIDIACAALGTDFAGSIRYPSAWCGVVGIKPTNPRSSQRGTQMPDPKADGTSLRELTAIVGPMGREIEDLAIILESTFGHFKNDIRAVPMKFDRQLYEQYSEKKGLKIGIVTKNRWVQIAPSIVNVMGEIKKDFSSRHQFIEFDFDQFWNLQTLAFAIEFSDDVDAYLSEALKGEKAEWFAKQAIYLSRAPKIVKKIVQFILARIENDPITGNVFNHPSNCKFKDYKKLLMLEENLRNHFFDTLNAEGIDILLTPVAVYPVPLLGETDLLNSPLYTLVTNFMQMPSGAVPIRLSKKGEQTYNLADPKNILQVNNTTRRMTLRQIEQDLNLPVAVMVTAKPFEDEKCLGFMKQLELHYQFDQIRQQLVQQIQ